MAYVHIAHDCQLGSHRSWPKRRSSAGHVHVGDWVILGGLIGRAPVRARRRACDDRLPDAAVAQDLPPFVTGGRQPRAGAGHQSAKACAAAASRPSASRHVKQMHRLLYREGLTLAAGTRGDQRSCASDEPDDDADVRADAATSSRPPSAASCAEPSLSSMPRLAMVAGEASGDLLAGLLLRRRAGALAASRGGRHRRPAHGGARLRGLVAVATSWRCAVTVEVLRHYREIAGIRNAAGRAAAAATSPTPSSASMRPTSTSTWRSGCARRGHQHRSTSSARRSGPGAASGSRRSRARSTMCCACFRSSRRCWRAHGIAATFVGHPLADAIPLRAAARRQPRRAGPGRRPTRWSPCCRAAGARRSSTIAPLFLQAAARLHRQRPACASCCRPRRACARMLEPMLAQHAAGDADHVARRPLARGAGRLRRDPDRQRHGDARGGAVQAADGDRLPHECLVWQIMRRMQLQPWVGLAQHPVPRLRGARIAAGRRHAGDAGTGRACSGSTRRSAARRCRHGFSKCTSSCGATPHERPPMRSRRFLRAEQLGLRLESPGAGGRRRRGGPRPAGRPGGGRSGDPRRSATRSRAWPTPRC